MYNLKNEQDAEAMSKEIKNLNELSIDKFATIPGIKGVQFGRDIYSSMLKFKDLQKFLEVFPDVQREVNKRNVGRIKTYVLNGIEETKALKFFSAITVTCRGSIFFDESTYKIAIDTRNSKMSINDGQTRFYGISEAIGELQAKVNRTTDRELVEKLRERLERLKNMVIPVTIFNQIGEIEEKQLFHDLNNLQQRPSRSATIKLAQTDLFSKMARELAIENDYLKRYGVEMDKMSIQKNNPNTVLLTTVYAVIKELFQGDYKKDKGFMTLQTYAKHKRLANTTFTQLFEALPKDITTKGKYIIEKHYALKGIAKFIQECRTDLELDEYIIFNAIRRVNWELTYENWGKFGAIKSKKGTVLFGGSGQGGVNGIYDCLMGLLQFKSNQITLEDIKEEDKRKGSAKTAG